MMGRLPRYAVPFEIKELVHWRKLQELTREGDPLRSFGVVFPDGVEIRLWVDRQERSKRVRTGFRFGVMKINPEGNLVGESSDNDMGTMLDVYWRQLEKQSNRFKKRWGTVSPEPVAFDWEAQ